VLGSRYAWQYGNTAQKSAYGANTIKIEHQSSRVYIRNGSLNNNNNKKKEILFIEKNVFSRIILFRDNIYKVN